MNEKYLCLIVDDDPWALVDLRHAIETSGLPFRVAGEARNAQKALEMIDELQPQLIITDICMGEMNGLDMIEECRRQKCRAEFAILSGYSEFKYARRAMENEVRYYLLKPINLHEVRRLLENVAASLSGRQSSCFVDRSTITRIVEYLRENLDQSMSLTEIAELFFLNKSHLSEMFKRETGKSFVQYKNEMRLEKAKTLLKETHTSIAQIGHQCGFQDAAYFTAVFRQANGVTPQQYRAGCCAEGNKHENS